METWNTILDFPEGIRITDVQITAQNAVGVRESDMSFRQEVQVFPGQRTRMNVNFLSHDPEKGSELEAFFLKLRTSAGRFRFFDPYHSKPMGQAMGLPVVTEALAGGQTLTTSGWRPNVNYQLRAGDYIQIGDDYHRVLDPVHSDGTGSANLTVWPNLRRSHVVDSPLTLINPTGLWRLSRDPSWSRTPAGQLHISSMACVEAL